MTDNKVIPAGAVEAGAAKTFIAAVGLDWWKGLDQEQASIIELGLSAIEDRP